MMADNPYRIEGPALISFSGGRTSAFMLRMILDAHGGALPDDVHVCFANTGKEREETLRFVHECGSRWGVRVRWLEWRNTPPKAPIADRFEEVGFNSASRNDEPFLELIRRKKYLPNAVTRFCTTHLKIETIKHFMLAQGYKKWINVVGLRGDEMHRVFKGIERNRSGKDRWQTVMPMATRAAGYVRKGTVTNFWLGENPSPRLLLLPLPQGFDLGLLDHEGNCNDCFLKGFAVLCHQEREFPGMADWWIGAEDVAAQLANKPSGARFVTEWSYRDMQRQALASPDIPGLIDETEYDAECGLWCADGN
jgi:hypothetical protein